MYRRACVKAFRSLTKYVNVHENKENNVLIIDLCVTELKLG